MMHSCHCRALFYCEMSLLNISARSLGNPSLDGVTKFPVRAIRPHRPVFAMLQTSFGIAHCCQHALWGIDRRPGFTCVCLILSWACMTPRYTPLKCHMPMVAAWLLLGLCDSRSQQSSVQISTDPAFHPCLVHFRIHFAHCHQFCRADKQPSRCLSASSL